MFDGKVAEIPSVILSHGGYLTYPNDPTGPSLDRAGDYDPDWDLPPDEVPADWMTKALDLIAQLACIAGVLVIVGMFALAIADVLGGR